MALKHTWKWQKPGNQLLELFFYCCNYKLKTLDGAILCILYILPLLTLLQCYTLIVLRFSLLLL